ncbi:MAG: sn-glycerol-1-phosphate dehydrogenase, partial [Clostridia bacterium]|nr:sn-glycerol-1-phosphate dehydrogenase [Clostridia bacterium]
MEFYGKKLQSCTCGKKHVFPLKEILSEKGAIDKLPDIVAKYGVKKPFIVADENTFKAAGKRVAETLKANCVPFGQFLFGAETVEPDEKAVERVLRAFDSSCDAVIGVGSGVINDICKILASKNDRFYIIVATAPSMDGYASATSSMAVKWLKTSLNSKCPDVIIGDVDVLKNAPLKMLKAGLGDMLAKYVSILEWRLSHEINGEYYCETVAEMIRSARDECVKNAAGLIKRDEKAVKAVFDGLIIGGIAMAYAGVSRPASGAEHYVSHIIDMRGLQFGTKIELHGIQCAIATLIVAKLYDKLKSVTINEEKAEMETRAFDKRAWEENLRAFLGG